MKCVLYARISTKDRGQEVENQLIQLREYCKKSGYELTGEYVDKISGAKGISERDAFNRLFKDAHKKAFDIVVFWSLDRFSREGARETLNYLNQLEGCGISFHSFTEPYLSSIGIFKEAIISLLATLAKQEKVRLTERIVAGLQRAKLEGKRLGRRPTINTDPEVLLRLRQEGKSFRQISRITNTPLTTVYKGLKNTASKSL